MSQTMSVALVLGLDIGSTTTKAALVAVADDVVVVRVGAHADARLALPNSSGRPPR